MRAAALEHFLGKQRRVDAAEDHVRAALARQPPDLVPAQRVARVNADPDDVSRFDLRGVERIERLVAEERDRPTARASRQRGRTAIAA